MDGVRQIIKRLMNWVPILDDPTLAPVTPDGQVYKNGA